MKAVRVSLMKRKGRPFWEAQWRDPETGKLRTESTAKERKRDAERVAGQIEAEVNAGKHQRQRLTPWADAADKYEAEVMAGRARKTAYKWEACRKHVQRLLNPARLAAVDSSEVSRFQAGLRDEGLKEATIKSTLSTLRAFLRWCARMKLLAEVPHIQMPIRTDKARGRPPTLEEFERMLKCVPDVVGDEHAAAWRQSLRGLWASGLRLGESLTATWHTGTFAITVATAKPRLLIQSLTDKSGKPRTLPLADDFWNWLWGVPEEGRHGHVFHFPMPYNPALRRADSISKIISQIGEKALVNVSLDDGVKWASAHDFRRAFGTRWAQRLFPKQLQELMRHRSISTTMTFYTHLEANDVEAAIEAAKPKNTNTSTNAPASGQSRKRRKAT